MLQNLGQLTILNRVFNLRDNEWRRVFNAWTIRFFNRLGFVMGWTVLVTLFVSNYGIISLPYLFLLNAVFTIIGSFLFSTFIERFEKYQIMIGCLVASGLLLFCSSFFASSNMPMFFALIIVAVGIFLTQFRILLYALTEDLFSPLESERTFPVIESADIIGGIFAGLMVMSFVSFMQVSSFVYVWTGVLFLTIPFVIFCYSDPNSLPHLPPKKNQKKEHASRGLLQKFNKVFSDSRHAPYVSGLFLIVIVQWLIFNLLEFQYVRAVYENVSGVILEAGSGFEHALVHDLGALFILFSASALFVQLILGSRIINYLGIVGTMIMHGLLVFFSVFGLTLSYSFHMAVLAKNNFTVGTVLFTNVYHSSFYALKHDVREYIREILEGLARPMGAILGAFGLIFIQNVFDGLSQIFFVNISMMVAILFFLGVARKQQKKYTSVAINDLLSSKNKGVRLNAIDILAQKGHKGSSEILRKVLFGKKEPLSIKLKIIKVLPELNSPDSMTDLMKCLKSKDPRIRSFALDSLSRFSPLLKKRLHGDLVYKRYKLISFLKEMYLEEKNSGITSKIISLISRISDVSVPEFLLQNLEQSSGKHKAEIILALGNYEDPEIADVLFSKLDSFSPFQKICAAIVLSGFKNFRSEAMRIVADFINSDKPRKIAYGLFAIGELKLSNKKKACYHYLYSKDKNLRIHSAIALLKMGSADGVAVIVELLIGGNRSDVDRVKFLMRNIDVRILKNVDKIVRDVVEKEVSAHFTGNGNSPFENWKQDSLSRLCFLYELVEEYEYVETIEPYIKHKI